MRCNTKPKGPLLPAGAPNSDAPTPTEPPPVLDRTTPLELVLALIAAAGLCYGYYCVGALLGPRWMIGLGAAWAVMFFRFHFQIWYYGGMKGYLYLTWRYPHCFIYTHALCLLYNIWKLAALVVHNLNPLFDDRGKMYKVTTPPSGLTLHDYTKMAMDLNKPRHFKKGHTYWWPIIYPNVVSPTICVNVYVIGPYAGFGSLPYVYSDHHITFRNDLLGTHPGYNNHVTLFFTDKKEGYWSINSMVLPPFSWMYKFLWEWYATSMHLIIAESEERATKHPTRTYQGNGRDLYFGEYDPPTF
ncbi:hypothetical protein T492DRAFT_1026992, partial [Pavlovales sp. CCMP2436]